MEYVCKMDEKSTWIHPYMASNGLFFMVTRTIFNNHFVEVGLTQNREFITLSMLIIVDLLYFIMCEDLHE